jgi:hypothetical protein
MKEYSPTEISQPTLEQRFILDTMQKFASVDGLPFEKQRAFSQQMEQELIGLFSSPARPKHQTEFQVRSIIKTANLLRLSRLPVDLNQPLKDLPIDESTTTIALARVFALSNDFDTVLPLLVGRDIDRNPKDHDPSCSECIAACCVSPAIEMDLPEAKQLLKAGTVMGHTLFDRYGLPVPQMLSQVTAEMHNTNKKHQKNKQDISAQAKRNQRTLLTDLNFADQKRATTKTIVGYCGHNENNFQCGCYSDRPKSCIAFEEGGDECKTRFTTRDSDAAKLILHITNDAKAVLQAAAIVYGLNRKPVEHFIPLESI